MRTPNPTSLFCGDCLEVLKDLPTETVDLVYLDPPFFTQKAHSLQTRDRKQTFSFNDTWKSELDYCQFLRERLVEIQRVLNQHGALFFHCDRNAAHLIRQLLDHLFGYKYFRSEIIWTYRRWSNSQRKLLPAHQTIYYYTKSHTYTFNTLQEDYSPSTNVDQILQKRARDQHGKSIYKRRQSGEVIAKGIKKGVPLGDVWDIPYLNPKAKERVGYPTQKPLLLLERIIQIASHEGDIILDPFCGSGTTLVAATLNGRKAIGIDVSEKAIQLTKERLKNPVKTESQLMRRGRHSYHNADESSLALLTGIQFVPVQRNNGMDALLCTETGSNSISVRIQRTSESLQDCATKLFKASQNKNIEIMFVVATASKENQGAKDELPPGVIVVDSPGLAIQAHLSELSAAVGGE